MGTVTQLRVVNQLPSFNSFLVCFVGLSTNMSKQFIYLTDIPNIDRIMASLKLNGGKYFRRASVIGYSSEYIKL